MNIYTRRRKYLEDLGFSEKAISRFETKTPKLFTEEYVASKLEGLHARGFTNPVKLITASPSILCFSFDNIDAKIAGLHARGFTNPVRLITLLPALFCLSFKNIDAKIAGLRARGFTDHVKLVTALPTLLSFSFSNIDARLTALQARGFTNPVKLVASSPTTLALSLHNIDSKLRHSRRMHFFEADVIPCIEKFPTLLGYSSKRIRLCTRIACSVSDANFKFFKSLITKDSLRITAAAISLQTRTKRAVMHAFRTQKDMPEENCLHVLNSSDKIALAYKQYCTL